MCAICMTSHNSNSIRLHSLEQEYNKLLEEHEQLHATYMQQLVAQKTNGNVEYSTHTKSTYWGTTPISEAKDIDDVNDCKSKCVANAKCTGATFDSEHKQCWLRGGYGELTSGTQSNSAIVSNIVETAKQLKESNRKIKTIRNEMQAIRLRVYDKYDTLSKHVEHRSKKVDRYDEIVKRERDELNRLEAKYGTLEEMDNDAMLYADQQYWWLSLWFIVACVFVIGLIVQFGSLSIYANTLNAAIYMIISLVIITLVIVVIMKFK